MHLGNINQRFYYHFKHFNLDLESLVSRRLRPEIHWHPPPITGPYYLYEGLSRKPGVEDSCLTCLDLEFIIRENAQWNRVSFLESTTDNGARYKIIPFKPLLPLGYLVTDQSNS